MTPAGATCYGVRRANPFRGVMAVVKTARGRALSADGQIWQIQVLAHPPRDLWSRAGSEAGQRYFRFGVFEPSRGLSQVPLSPLFDAVQMVAVAHELVQAVREATPRLPFPLADRLELWQLDRAARPFALLATAVSEAEFAEIGVPTWQAGLSSDRPWLEQESTLTDRGVAELEECLQRLVRTTSGRSLNRQWFRRTPDGGGVGLGEGAPASHLVDRHLARSDFPPVPLRTEWPDPEAQRLTATYLDWLAPYLLTLDQLTEDQRRHWETAAVRYPVLVDRLWRMFPRVIDHQRLQQARVEARLRRAHAA